MLVAAMVKQHVIVFAYTAEWMYLNYVPACSMALGFLRKERLSVKPGQTLSQCGGGSCPSIDPDHRFTRLPTYASTYTT